MIRRLAERRSVKNAAAKGDVLIRSGNVEIDGGDRFLNRLRADDLAALHIDDIDHDCHDSLTSAGAASEWADAEKAMFGRNVGEVGDDALDEILHVLELSERRFSWSRVMPEFSKLSSRKTESISGRSMT